MQGMSGGMSGGMNNGGSSGSKKFRMPKPAKPMMSGGMDSLNDMGGMEHPLDPLGLSGGSSGSTSMGMGLQGIKWPIYKQRPSGSKSSSNGSSDSSRSGGMGGMGGM